MDKKSMSAERVVELRRTLDDLPVCKSYARARELLEEVLRMREWCCAREMIQCQTCGKEFPSDTTWDTLADGRCSRCWKAVAHALGYPGKVEGGA